MAAEKQKQLEELQGGSGEREVMSPTVSPNPAPPAPGQEGTRATRAGRRCHRPRSHPGSPYSDRGCWADSSGTAHNQTDTAICSNLLELQSNFFKLQTVYKL